MRQINLVFDEVYDDADILLVPDWVAEQAVLMPGRYSEWLVSQGRTDMETDGFVAWLNAQIGADAEKVRIIAQHVTVSESEPSIDF